MAAWWKKLFGKKDPAKESEVPLPAKGTQPSEKARWLAADDRGNPFGVELLDLMITQKLLATTTDPAIADRAMSWGSSTGEELDAAPVLACPAVEVTIRLPVDRSLPDGLLFLPASMDEKWVIAWRRGQVIAARSWTAWVEAVADARIEGGELVIERIRALDSSPLVTHGALPETFEWLLRSHALRQRIAFPASEAGARMFENAPLTAFASFGKLIFCAAKVWQPKPAPKPLRTDGRIIVAARADDVPAIERAIADGEMLDAPGTYGGYTALHLAIVHGNTKLFERLVALGADPERRVDGGNFALGIAIVEKAPPELFAALERAGVDLMAANDDGFNALHAACEVDSAWAVRWLVERGHGLEPRTKRGHTPLQIACALGHLAAARALVELGADVDAPSPGPRHPGTAIRRVPPLPWSSGSPARNATSGLTGRRGWRP